VESEGAKKRFEELASEFVRLAAHMQALQSLRHADACADDAGSGGSTARAEPQAAAAAAAAAERAVEEAGEAAMEEARLAREMGQVWEQTAAETALCELGRRENAQLAARLAELQREEPTRDSAAQTAATTSSAGRGEAAGDVDAATPMEGRVTVAMRTRDVLETLLGVRVVSVTSGQHQQQQQHIMTTGSLPQASTTTLTLDVGGHLVAIAIADAPSGGDCTTQIRIARVTVTPQLSDGCAALLQVPLTAITTPEQLVGLLHVLASHPLKP